MFALVYFGFREHALGCSGDVSLGRDLASSFGRSVGCV